MWSKQNLASICLLELFLLPWSYADTLAYDTRLLRPLPVHNFYPAMMHTYDPVPSSALASYRPEYQLGLDQHYSSVFIYDHLPNGKLLADMEIYTLEFKLDKAVTESTALGITLPIHYAWDGFLDGFLRSYHDALGLPNSAREFRPENEYAWHYATNNGEISWQDTSGWEMGNLVLRLKHQLASREQDGLALLAALQLPTASVSRGWSSGQADLAAGLVYSWHGDHWFGHLEGWAIHPVSDSETGIDYHDYARGSVTLGWLVNEKLSFLGQIQGGNSPYESGLRQLDDGPSLINFGLNWMIKPGTMITVALVENISQKTTPDFGLTVGLDFTIH